MRLGLFLRRTYDLCLDRERFAELTVVLEAWAWLLKLQVPLLLMLLESRENGFASSQG